MEDEGWAVDSSRPRRNWWDKFPLLLIAIAIFDLIFFLSMMLR